MLLVDLEESLIKANKLYNIAKTKNDSSNTVKANIRKTAKKVAATNNGQFKILCKTIDKIIVATGIAKNINKISNNE